MISLSQIRSVEQALSYYHADDYYSEGEQAPSRWLGHGANALGLTGVVDREDLAWVLAGALPDGRRLGVRYGKEVRHNPGVEVTISAPKSLSVAVLVAGDDQLREAHRQAVGEVVDYLQEHATARVRDADGDIELHETRSIAVAAFEHTTSRELDPQLHTHCLIANMTQDRYTGEWRSLERRGLFRLQIMADEVYKQALASRVRTLGYQIRQTQDGWELAGLGDEALELFSGRTKAIDTWLAERGYTRETAHAEIRERAAIATRTAKQKGVDHFALRDQWIERAQDRGAEVDRYRYAIQPVSDDERLLAAAGAVDRAIADISERVTRFTMGELEQRALREARATAASLADIQQAIGEAAESRRLLPAIVETARGEAHGWTSREAIRVELAAMLAEERGRDSVAPILGDSLSRAAVASAERMSLHPWTAGQRVSTRSVLSSPHRVQGIQGYAGTAKTSTVLRTVAAVATAEGYLVKGMAPTHSAAQQLADGAAISATGTVKRHLVEQKKSSTAAGKQELWLVDEASLLSSRDTAQLLQLAEKTDARIVLVGDVQQLGSIEAGEAFRQLQENGMATHVLDEVVRQRVEATRDAVYGAISGDIQSAMQSIARSGLITEHPEKTERLTRAATDYLSLSPAERAETLVLEPTRAGRAALNAQIRTGLRAEGSISGDEIKATALEKADITAIQAKDASRYVIGDVVIFNRDMRSLGIRKHDYHKIEQVDLSTGTVHLRSDNGAEVLWLPARLGAGRIEIYREEQLCLAVGDRITWTRSDKTRGLKNGSQLEVEVVEGSVVRVRDDRGRLHEIDVAKRQGQHFRHAYALTVHAAQGRTADRVIAHLSGSHRSLVSQRSFYVSASRAKEEVRIYTDSSTELIRHIENHSGQQQTAVDMMARQNGRDRAAELYR